MTNTPGVRTGRWGRDRSAGRPADRFSSPLRPAGSRPGPGLRAQALGAWGAARAYGGAAGPFRRRQPVARGWLRWGWDPSGGAQPPRAVPTAQLDESEWGS